MPREVLTAEQVRAESRKGRKRSKYGAVRTVVGNVEFASKKEANRFIVLREMLKQNLIRELRLQPEFLFLENDKSVFIYRADFSYWENGKQIVEDVKGFRTPVYRLKKKLIEARYGIEIQEV